MDRGPELQAARRRKLMSQEHLASVSGVSVRTIRRAENGEAISGESMRCLCATLELPAEVAPAPADPRETVEASLTERETLLVHGLTLTPVMVAALAALSVLMGAWPQAGILPVALLAANLGLACAGPAIARRLEAASNAILMGFAFLNVGVLWLINFGANSPKTLQVMVITQMIGAMAMMAVGIRSRHREWLARAASDAEGNG